MGTNKGCEICANSSDLHQSKSAECYEAAAKIAAAAVKQKAIDNRKIELTVSVAKLADALEAAFTVKGIVPTEVRRDEFQAEYLLTPAQGWGNMVKASVRQVYSRWRSGNSTEVEITLRSSGGYERSDKRSSTTTFKDAAKCADRAVREIAVRVAEQKAKLEREERGTLQAKVREEGADELRDAGVTSEALSAAGITVKKSLYGDDKVWIVSIDKTVTLESLDAVKAFFNKAIAL